MKFLRRSKRRLVRAACAASVATVLATMVAAPAHATEEGPKSVTFTIPATPEECAYLVANYPGLPCVDLVKITLPRVMTTDGESYEIPAASLCTGDECLSAYYPGPGWACGTQWYFTTPGYEEVTDVTGGHLWKGWTTWWAHGTVCQNTYWDTPSCGQQGFGYSIDRNGDCGVKFNNGAGAPYYYTRSRTDWDVSFAFHGFPGSSSHHVTMEVDTDINVTYYYG